MRFYQVAVKFEAYLQCQFPLPSRPIQIMVTAFNYIHPVLLILLLAHCGETWKEDTELDSFNENNLRSQRFFPFFLGPTVIRIDNGHCMGENGFVGTCFTRNECSSYGGKASGTCSQGFGRCCILQKTCGMHTKVNCTYFVNPGYPASYAGGDLCSLTVWPCGDSVCQLRLDFLDFDLSPPDANGNCLDDFFLITGGGSNVPRICGLNTGQHVYVDFAGTSPIVLTIDTNKVLSYARKWNIKVTQVKCCNRAPVGCLMDYKGTSGKVMSFNYSPTASSTMLPDSPPPPPATPGTRELANLNYGVCIEMAPGYCSIEWSQNPSDPYSFTVSGDTSILDGTVLGMPDASVTGTNCTGDFIVIPSPMQGGVTLPYDRFCGNALPTVTSSSKPFVLTVVTNNTELADPPDVGNRGFCLNFRQLPCAI